MSVFNVVVITCILNQTTGLCYQSIDGDLCAIKNPRVLVATKEEMKDRLPRLKDMEVFLNMPDPYSFGVAIETNKDGTQHIINVTPVKPCGK